jgi:GxxExxY protein
LGYRRDVNHERHEHHEKILHAQEAYRVQGAVFEVYRETGAGFLEAVYHECLTLEFTARRIPFVSKGPLRLAYKGAPLRQTYTPDFVCFDCIVVELKAARQLAPEHRAQALNYLRATGHRLALLVNFGARPHVEIERVVL